MILARRGNTAGTSIAWRGWKGKGIKTPARKYRGGRERKIPLVRAAKNGGDKMDVFDQNVKIHVDTSDLDAAIKKRNNYLHF